MKREGIAKIIFWLLSITLGIMAIYIIAKTNEYLVFILTSLSAILVNPKFSEVICKKSGIKQTSYLSASLPALIMLSLPLSLIIAVLSIKVVTTTNEFAGVFKLSLYTFSLLVIIFAYNLNRKKMFIVFTIVYVVFTTITISNGVLNNLIATISSMFPDINCTSDDITFLCDNFISPIKEAMLTYIIFQVIKQESEKEKNNLSNID